MSTQKSLDNHRGQPQTLTDRRSWLQNTKRAHRNPAMRPGSSVEASHNDELTMQHQTRPPEKLPDPWLFDSEALIRELDRCRETVLQIPITNPNATHFGIQLAVNAIYNLTENLRYLLYLHRDAQHQIRKQHEQSPQHALSGHHATTNIVPLAKRARKAAAHLRRMEISESLPRAGVTLRTTAFKRRGERS